MASLCILGAEGSGKTVLLTVIGQKYLRPDANGVFLEPLNRAASDFIFKNWELMTEAHKWPTATLPGQLAKLHFNLHFKDNSHELLALDYAGETYREVFGRGKSEQPHQKELIAHVMDSSLILLLVNLKDIINRDASERGMENFWLPNATLNFIRSKSPNKPVFLVLTQIDRYREYLAENDSWRKVLMKYIPIFAAAYPDITIVPVSAVNKIDIDDEGHTVPSEQFQQEGIENLFNEIQREINQTVPGSILSRDWKEGSWHNLGIAVVVCGVLEIFLANMDPKYGGLGVFVFLIVFLCSISFNRAL